MAGHAYIGTKWSSDSGPQRIRDWLKEGRDVHVYFDNDALGAAPKNAQELMGLVNMAKHRRH